MADATPNLPPAPPMRPRPVLLLGALIAGLDAFVGAGALLDFLPKSVVGIVALISVVVGASGAVLVQGTVTPLSAPQDSRGRELVPESTALASVRSAARAGAREGLAGVTIQQ
jgi:hypothetical protein